MTDQAHTPMSAERLAEIRSWLLDDPDFYIDCTERQATDAIRELLAERERMAEDIRAYENACEIDQETKRSYREQLNVAEDRLIAAESALSAARAEREKVRAATIEECAKLCEAVRDAKFNELPHYADEPDFDADDVCSETVCAWHIRAALAHPAQREGGGK